MDRLDRKAGVMPAPLEAALGELQASIERHASEIVRAAAARASVIEDQAVRKARELEENSSRASAAVDRATRAVDRATRMLEAIDSTQSSFTESLGSLRTETERLLEVLEHTRPAAPRREPEANGHSTEKADEAMAELLFLDEPYGH